MVTTESTTTTLVGEPNTVGAPTTIPLSATTSATAADPDGDLVVALDAITRLVPELEGVGDYGWDPSHGAPYSAISYQREGDIYGLIAVPSESGDLGAQLAIGENGTVPTDAPTVIEGTVALRVFQDEESGAHIAFATGVCDKFDVWGQSFAATPDRMLADLAAVVTAVVCESS